MKTKLFLLFSNLFFSVAIAETWEPMTVINLKTTSKLNIHDGTNINCDLSGSMNIDLYNNPQSIIKTFELTGGIFEICRTIGFKRLPYHIQGNKNGTVTIKNVFFEGISINCKGDLTGRLYKSSGNIVFNKAKIYSENKHACIFTGSIITSPKAIFRHL